MYSPTRLWKAIECNIHDKFWPRYNRIRLKHYGNQVHVGENCQVKGAFYIRISDSARLMIGDNFHMLSGHCTNPLARNIKGCFAGSGNIIIGDNVGLSSTCIWAHTTITIGNNVNIGGDTILVDSDCHSLNYLDRRPGGMEQNKKSAPITIEDDVLIGTRCIILKGVTIGARSVIGAGSVVSKSIPSDCIAVGNPAKVIKPINKDNEHRSK